MSKLTEEEKDRQVEVEIQTAKQIANNSIILLETTVTDRRLREAVLGVDGGWLANVNSQINQLRAVT